MAGLRVVHVNSYNPRAWILQLRIWGTGVTQTNICWMKESVSRALASVSGCVPLGSCHITFGIPMISSILPPLHASKVLAGEILCTAYLVSLNSDILHNYSTVSQPGYWHWLDPLIMFHLLSHIYSHFWCIFSSIQLNHVWGLQIYIHHIQDSEYFHHHRDPSCCPYINITTLTSLQ